MSRLHAIKDNLHISASGITGITHMLSVYDKHNLRYNTIFSESNRFLTQV